jgi:hypothetical protein
MTAPHCGHSKTVADGLGEVDVCMGSPNQISLAFHPTKISWRNRVFCDGTFGVGGKNENRTFQLEPKMELGHRGFQVTRPKTA